MISSEIWRRGWDSNPRLLLGEPLFESGALSQLGNLSASPFSIFARVLIPPALAQPVPALASGWDMLARFAPSASSVFDGVAEPTSSFGRTAFRERRLKPA